jgi:hypothetical protein
MTRCLNESMLQAWLDGELSPHAAAAAQSHVAVCAVCAAAARDAKKQLALVDSVFQAGPRLDIPAARLHARLEERLAAAPPPDRSWRTIAFRQWRIAAAAAVFAIAVAGAVLLQQDAPAPSLSERSTMPEAPPPPAMPAPPANEAAENATRSDRPTARPTRPPVQAASKPASRRPSWLESETKSHLGQTQVLLRSIRNVEAETVPDLEYEREMSRELLSRNRLLRRSAEQKNERRAEELLSQIEPLLLDIANLPERPAMDEMRSLKELIREQQIIAELQLYTGRNLF